MNNKFITPIDKEVMKIQLAKERFSILIVFNELVEDMMKTDRQIEKMEDGAEKEELKRAQDAAWELMFDKDFSGTIMLEE